MGESTREICSRVLAVCVGGLVGHSPRGRAGRFSRFRAHRASIHTRFAEKAPAHLKRRTRIHPVSDLGRDLLHLVTGWRRVFLHV